jgi:hypothetical protein
MVIYGEYMEYLPMSIYFRDTFGGVGLVEVLREPLHGDWHKAATRREQVTSPGSESQLIHGNVVPLL